MTEILVSDVNLNSVCERLEQQCCVDQNQHNLSSQPQTPVLKRHSNTGAKLWGRVRSKLLRQKVSLWLTYAHTHTCHIHTQAVFPLLLSFVLSYLSLCHFHLFVLPLFYSQCILLSMCVRSLPGCLSFSAEFTIVLI